MFPQRNTQTVQLSTGLFYFFLNFKGEFTRKWKIHIFALFCSAIYPLRLFRCELSSFGAIHCTDVCLLSNIMELGGTSIVVLKAQKIKKVKSSTAMCMVVFVFHGCNMLTLPNYYAKDQFHTRQIHIFISSVMWYIRMAKTRKKSCLFSYIFFSTQGANPSLPSRVMLCIVMYY